jgi:ABC-type oligopeptide transport system ATPase subunit
VVESADRERLYADAQHPYTRALLSAAPIPDPRIERTRERVPRPVLSDAQMSLREVSPGHLVADL